MTDLTRILHRVEKDDPKAADELLPLVYEELRKLAAARMANEAAGHTLQPTALVHEAWLRLVGEARPAFENRGHFFFAAAEAMRCILVEKARRKNRLRHGGELKRVDFTDLDVATAEDDDAVLAVSEALELIDILRGDLDWIVMKALEKDGTRRYETANGSHFLALSPDGHRLAVGGDRWQLFDTTRRQQEYTGTNWYGVRGLVFSPDSQQLDMAAGTEIRVLDVASRQTRIIDRSADQIDEAAHIGLAFSPDGQSLAYGLTDPTIRLTNFVTKSRLTMRPTDIKPDNIAFSLVFSHDGRFLISGGKADSTFGMPLRERLSSTAWPPRPGHVYHRFS